MNYSDRKVLSLKRRYFYNCGEEWENDICEAFRSGYQLDHKLLPYDAIPAVLVLATWLRNYRGLEILEDYDGCVLRQQGIFGMCMSPVLYLASCICILYEREEHPGEQAFIAEKIPQIYAQVMEEPEPVAAPVRNRRKRR